MATTVARRASVESRLGDTAPMVAACFAVLALGLPPVMTRAMHADPQAIVLVRLWTIVPIWWLILKASGGRLTWEVMRTSLPSGILFGMSTALSVQSFKTTSIANATLIPSMQPAVIMFLAWKFYGERRSARDLLFGALALTGILAVVLGAGHSSGSTRSGNLVAVAGLVVLVAYMMRLKQVRNRGIPVRQYLLSMLMWAALVVTPWAFATDGRAAVSIHGGDWALIIGVNIVSFIIGHGLLTWAQASLEVSTTTLLQLGSPVVSMIGAWWIHHQSLKPMQLLGGAVVLASLAGIITRSRPASSSLEASAATAPAAVVPVATEPGP
jgi:drug/metabolite transporter (DMT)-like permease